MSNKSAGPVKTHQEKLIDKAQKAIREFWPPESGADPSAETENQNAEVDDSQSTKLSKSNQNMAKDKKLKSSNEHGIQSIKKDDNTQSKKDKSKNL